MNNSYKKFRIVHRIPFNFSNGIKYYDERVAKIFAVSRFYKSRNRSLEPEDFGRGWILKEEAERTNKEFYGCVRVPTSRMTVQHQIVEKKKKRRIEILGSLPKIWLSKRIKISGRYRFRFRFGGNFASWRYIIFFFHYLISDKKFLEI